MRLYKSFAIFLVSSLCALPLKAQIRPQEIGLTVGVNVPMYEGVESDVTLGVTYGHTYHNGLGFRTGLQYTPSVADVDNSFGIPLALSYRTASRSTEERFRSGINGAASSGYWNVYYDYDGTVPSREMFASFLASLFSNAEVSVGLTPGYIAGESSSREGTEWLPGATFKREWTELENKFFLSLDAGFCINYSIWRFDIKLMPSFHYNLTDNYVRHKEIGSPYATGTKNSSRPIKWFFTFSGGLSFRF